MHALDGSRIEWLRLIDAQVLVMVVTVTESALVRVQVLEVRLGLVIVLISELLGLLKDRDPMRRPIAASTGTDTNPATACGHPRQQELVTIPGIFGPKRSGVRIWNKFVFTFTGRGRGWKRPGNGLLARLSRAWSRSTMLLLSRCRL